MEINKYNFKETMATVVMTVKNILIGCITVKMNIKNKKI